jgi:hypothetical protein
MTLLLDTRPFLLFCQDDPQSTETANTATGSEVGGVVRRSKPGTAKQLERFTMALHTHTDHETSPEYR